jgi:hypothetical protein
MALRRTAAHTHKSALPRPRNVSYSANSVTKVDIALGPLCASTRRHHFKAATTSATRFVLRIRVSRASKGNKSERTRCFSDSWKKCYAQRTRGHQKR